jgi:modulator of FtsH protease HflC
MAKRLAVSVAILLAAVLLWRSVFIVDESELALLTRFGHLLPTAYAAGAHFKSPLDEAHRFDRRLITRSYLGESFLTKDQKSLTVDFYLRWRLVDPVRLFAANGGDEDATAARMAELVRERIRTTLAAAPLATDITDTHLASGALHSDPLRTCAEQLGVALVDVQLQRIDLPEEMANAVYQRMQQSLLAQAQQLRAQGGAEADKIRSDAEHRRAEILADATREAQRVRGEADSAASATYARAYGANPEFAAFTRSLQAYKNSLGREGDILVISPEGEFFKYLHSASGR